MQSVRIIPCLDVDSGRVVKGVNFTELRDAGDPVELASFYDDSGADELVFLDITASSDNRNTMLDVVYKTAEEVFIPFTVGGGVRTVEDARKLLRAGADKVGINTAAIANPELISEMAFEFGSQCVVVAIDAKKVGNSWKVFTHGGRRETNLDAIEWAQKCQQLGAGELLVTSMDRDGTKQGYDLDLTSAISTQTCLPTIASGGVGKLEDFEQGARIGKADGLLAASIFHYKQLSIEQTKQYLSSQGITVRPLSL